MWKKLSNLLKNNGRLVIISKFYIKDKHNNKGIKGIKGTIKGIKGTGIKGTGIKGHKGDDIKGTATFYVSYPIIFPST